MFLPFEKLPESSRIWIYQSSRIFENSEVSAISAALENFISDWDSHGAPVTGSFKIFYNRFIVIAVNDQLNAPSGCSIDKSVAIIKEIENHFDTSLFDRTEVAYWNSNKLATITLPKIKEAVIEGKIGNVTVIFNNTINTIKELENNWQILAEDSWMKRYFKKQTV